MTPAVVRALFISLAARTYPAHEMIIPARAADAYWIDSLSKGTIGIHAAQQLLARPLWPEASPAIFDKHWSEMKAGLRKAGDDCDIWIDWYENRLAGKGYDFSLLRVTEHEVIADIATEESFFWERPPAEVNADIKARLLAANERIVPDTKRSTQPDRPENNSPPQVFKTAIGSAVVANYPQISTQTQAVPTLVQHRITELEGQRPNSEEAKSDPDLRAQVFD